MNRNQLKRKRDKLSQDLREAKLRHNYVLQAEIMQELRKLDKLEIDLDREVRKITYADIAKQNMTDDEIRNFSATMIELAIYILYFNIFILIPFHITCKILKID